MRQLPTDTADVLGMARRPSAAIHADVPAVLNPEAAYSVRVVLAVCGVGRSTIYRAMSARKSYRGTLPHLPSFTIAGRRMIRGRAVVAWLDACEAQSES